MFALIRNLIGRPNRNSNRHSGSLMTSSLAAAPTLPQSRVVSTNPTACPTTASAPASAAPLPAGHAAPLADNGETISLPLALITARFSAELRAALVAQPSEAATVSLPLNLLLQQLATGAVRLPLGYLRQTSSEACFANTQQFDAMPVTLPIEEVLARISPAQLPRRAKTVTSVPDSVTAPFGGRQAVAVTPRNEVMAPPPAPAPAPEPAPEPVAVAAVEPTLAPEAAVPALTHISMPVGAVPSSAAQAQVAARSVLPTRPMPAATLSTPAKTVPLPTLARPTVAATPQRTVAPVPPDSIPSPFAVSPPSVHSPAAAAPEPVAPAVPLAARRETSFFRAGCLTLPLTRLSNGWPAPVLQEIANQHLAAESVELPFEEVEAGLKQGRLAFTWRQIRAWTPAVQKPLQESALDSTALELPLRFVAPLFLSMRPMEQRQRPAVGEGIPNIFGPGSLAAETSSFQKDSAPAQVPATAKPATAAADPWDTQFEVKPEATISLPKLDNLPAPAAPSSAATETSYRRRTVDVILGDPGKDSWTPMEVVRKISRMKGVAGATMATQDGLLVAEQYPALVGVDTFCALTTQAFNRVFATAMELRLGGPARMSFVAESVTYEIYRCGRLFMTVISQPGEKLPSHDLSVIADHLTNQSR